MKEEKEIRELSIRYFEGCISRADENELSAYIEQRVEHRLQFRQWEKEWLLTQVSTEETNREWGRLQSRVRTREAVAPILPKHTAFWRKAAAVAAIVLITVGTMIGIQTVKDAMQAETYFVFEAPYGEKSKMILSDGTVVWLNAGSTLTYSNQFNTHNRNVKLLGEAYFEVTRNEGATFTVQTCGYDVVVKGTKFNISAYPDDWFVTTTLLEGQVELHDGSRCLALSSGECVSLDTQSGVYHRSRVNAAQSIAWSENRIEFDNITLKELAAKLSRQYDVHIRLDSEMIGEKRFRISLRNQETISEVMTALQKIIPISVEHKGKDIYIRE